jgi:hypothetical protein
MEMGSKFCPMQILWSSISWAVIAVAGFTVIVPEANKFKHPPVSGME